MIDEQTKILFWEPIKSNRDEYMERAKVFGGWLVKVYVNVWHQASIGERSTGNDFRVSMTFVPDINWDWEIL